MPSTYSNLKIELMGTGDQSGTWGTTTNTNLGTAIEEAITGSANVTFASADVTLTLTNTNTSQTARNLRLNLTGTSGGARNLIVPSIEKQYIINNGLADAVTVKNSTGTGVTVPVGKSVIVFNNGTDVVDATTHLSSLTLGSALPVASGGTGASTATITSFNNITGYTASGATGTTSSNLVFSADPTITGTLTSSGTLAVTGGLTLDGAAGTSGQVMLSAGAGNTPTWGSITSFVAGMIMLWSGSSASIPSGWLLCDGTSGTPDLRNRFVVGATSTYAVGATGGSADAIVVSHTHTATVTDPQHTHGFSYPLRLGTSTDGTTGTISGGGNAGSLSINSASTGITVSNSTTGSSGTNANLPPYYALCYIMKS